MKATTRLCLATVLVLLLGTAGPALAQQETGNVYVKVLDSGGTPLPGVTVELTGMGAPRLMVTNVTGEARFLGLDPGSVSLRASLEGFSTLEYPNIDVRAARNTSLEVQLTEAIGEVITVTSESPLLDERRLETGTTVTQVELETIPTARDPWSVLNQTPTVLVDRINVGGNQSGQQSNFRAPASDRFENDFLVDGVQITDMAATGSSPTYYDFDQFSEMQFATGGSDITKTTAGVSINMVTKRGTNEFRGSGRYLLTDAGGYFGALEQGDANVDDQLAPGQDELVGNEIDRIEDYGFEAGGPVVRDRLWLWGSWGRNEIRQFAAGGIPDNTSLENTAIKLNAQLAAPNSFIASFNNGNKVKSGRNASPIRPAETTMDQRGPTGIYKVEDTHVFNSNFFLTGTWSKVDGGFQLISQGQKAAGCFGTDCPLSVEPFRDVGGVYRNSYYLYSAKRPAEALEADGSYFFNTGASTSHELKFGARYRVFETGSDYVWPGRNLRHFDGERIGWPENQDYIYAYRGLFPLAEMDYTSLWVQDTISLGRWTINAGLRWDVSDGRNPADSVPANPAFPELLPAIDFAGDDAGGFDYNTFVPRVGVTYAFGSERSTLFRGSFSQFPQVLDASAIQNVNPLGIAVAGITFEDLNGNSMWDGEQESWDLWFASGFDPADPAAATSPSETDPGLDPAITNEIILGVEHSFLPEFVAALQFTWRNTTDYQEFQRLIRDADGNVRTETRADYEIVGEYSGTLPDGSPYLLPEWNLRDEFQQTGGWLLTNGGRELDYSGVNLNFTKRLSNQWMLRGFVNYAFDESWSVPSDYLDDTNGPNPVNTKSDCNGCTYAMQSSASGFFNNVFMQSNWSWNLNGMYQIAPDRPWGFNVAANLYGRHGYPFPYFITEFGQQDGIERSISVVDDVDQFRAPNLLTTDIRLEKEFAATSGVGFTFSIDGFNIFNETTTLQRELEWNSPSGDYLLETLSPRIWRLGVRINWR